MESVFLALSVMIFIQDIPYFSSLFDFAGKNHHETSIIRLFMMKIITEWPFFAEFMMIC